jgi:molybdopterin-containing oxidoreductase family iron-sulfur binding subunit
MRSGVLIASSPESEHDAPNRLYVAEAVMSLTGMNADHRLRLSSSEVGALAAGLAKAVAKDIPGLDQLPAPASVQAKWIEYCAKDLAAHRGKCVVMAGNRQPLAVHLLVHAMNAALGNMGQTVLLTSSPSSQEGNITELAKSLNAGEVNTLVILGGNPVYNAPADLDWAKTQRKAKTIVRLATTKMKHSKFATGTCLLRIISSPGVTR